jgi:hypothetical protein
MEIRLNIFSLSGIIFPESITWFDPVETVTPIHSFLEYEKSLVKHNVIFDKTRFCELENLIHVWKNEKSLTKKTNIDEFKLFFNKKFYNRKHFIRLF